MNNYSVLIVDDDKNISDLIKLFLKQSGYTITGIATNGHEAMQYVKEQIPDIVIMDIFLQGKRNGIDLVQDIYKIRNIPIVYITAYEDADLFQKAKITKPYGYIIKPFNKRELLIAVEIALYRKEQEDMLAFMQEYSSSIINSSMDMIIAVDNKRKITEFNKVAEINFGYNKEELVGKHINVLYTDSKEGLRIHKRTISSGTHISEVKNRRKNGEIFTSILASSVLTDRSGNKIGVMGISRDISKEKEIEESIYRSKRAQNALIQCNEYLLYTTDENDLLKKVCRSVVKDCGYRLVWVAYAKNDKQKSVIPVAYYGYEEGYLEKLNITWADSERGHGPTGRAIQSKEVQISNNIPTNPNFKHWKNDALERGYKSSIAIPLIPENGILGTINIYAPESNAFDPDEAILLQNLANNLAFGISAIRNHKQQELDREKIISYSNRLKAITDAILILSQTLDSSKVARRCAKIASELFDTDSVTIFSINVEKSLLIPIISIGNHAKEIMAMKLNVGEGISGKVASSGMSRVIDSNELLIKGKHVNGTPEDEPESILSAPIISQDNITGVITLSKYGIGKFSEKDIEFINILADLCSIALKNAELFENAKTSEKMKMAFLANMSHEIRTPINSIIGFTDLIEEHLEKHLGEKEKEFFTIIHSSVDRLLRTIHEILDISSIETKSYSIKPVATNLIKLISTIVSEFKLKAKSKNLKLSLTTKVENPYVYIDKYCIENAISNILDNAIKYTQIGKISVEFKESSKKILCIISDTGIGMSEKYQKHLFDAFSQESTGNTRKYQGVGLGLALTKHYLDMNKIPIEVYSKRGEGSRFTLIFTSIEKTPEKLKSLKKKPKIAFLEDQLTGSILVVEDDINSQNLIKYFIGNKCELNFAVSVKEAKNILKEKNIILILLDLSLTGKEDGLVLARYVRKTSYLKNIPIIALTAHAFTQDRDNALNSGCDDYMTKPLDREKFLNKIQYILSVKH
ncbi:response regulator [Candidatus Pacearchaeota archaeon]|nr:response regulator [Candidatus Pacearchaeota archaeon]